MRKYLITSQIDLYTIKQRFENQITVLDDILYILNMNFCCFHQQMNPIDLSIVLTHIIKKKIMSSTLISQFHK